MKLWYDKPASKWEEALPIGNGRMGGMVFGKIREEKILLNEDSIWSGRHIDRINPDAKSHIPEIRRLIREGRIEEAQELLLYTCSGVPESQRAYQPAGQCEINFKNTGEVKSYRRELDLERGIVTVCYDTADTIYRREYFASYPDGIMAVHMKAEGEKKISLDIRLGRCRNWMDEVGAKDGTYLYLHGNTGEGGIGFCVSVSVASCDGTVRSFGEYLLVEEASEITLYLAAETTWRCEDPSGACRDKLLRQAKKSYAECKKVHVEDFQKLFQRLRLSFETEDGKKNGVPTDVRLREVKRGGDDAGLMAVYFQYGRYLLISSSRPGSLPANLQGIWNESLTPPWDSKFTININTEMNYWIAEGGNLAECHLPLFDHLEKVKEDGKKTAGEMYGCRGSVAHHNTDIYGDSAPQDHYLPATFWVMGEAWLATHVWEHFQYTRDKEFLEQHFDLLEQSVLFFFDFLVEMPDGTLVTSPSVSPENTYIMPDGTRGCLCEGATMDIEILTELFGDYIAACRVLGRPEESIRQAQEIMGRFPTLKIGSRGQLQEWMEDYEEAEPGHRHISHLYGVYPGTMINETETPELMDAARISLERRLANGGGHTGWSRAWLIALWARFREGKKAYENWKTLLKMSTFDNLLDNHPAGDGFVFQIDGNLGASAAFLEMLVQCDGKRICLLPAMPPELDSGSVCGLCLRGGLELTMEWRAGKVAYMKILPKEDCCMSLEVNGEQEMVSFFRGILFERAYKRKE